MKVLDKVALFDAIADRNLLLRLRDGEEGLEGFPQLPDHLCRCGPTIIANLGELQRIEGHVCIRDLAAAFGCILSVLIEQAGHVECDKELMRDEALATLREIMAARHFRPAADVLQPEDAA